MAKFYPTIDSIKNLKQKPTPGEMAVLKSLEKALDDTFCVYFNPYLNGDRPDIVLMSRKLGIQILEVKDYNPDAYQISKGKIRVRSEKSNPVYLRCPEEQAKRYKDNLINLHCASLAVSRRLGVSVDLVVSTLVVYTNFETNDIIEYSHVVKNPNGLGKGFDYTTYCATGQYFLSFTMPVIEAMSNGREELYLPDEIFEELDRILNVPDSTRSYAVELDKAQVKLSISRTEHVKIKGAVGSGKTAVMASRAVNAQCRTGSRVLVLCFNKTLRNYLHDRISAFRGDVPWIQFDVIHYHGFIKSQMNVHNIKVEIPKDLPKHEVFAYIDREYYSNARLFVGRNTVKYDAILIDEIQDFRLVWMRMIVASFLSDRGEYALFGDEKQSLYIKSSKNTIIDTNVEDDFKCLTTPYRSDTAILRIADYYQREVFKEQKYMLDSLERSAQGRFDFSGVATPRLEYLYRQVSDAQKVILIKAVLEDLHEHPNDVVVLATRHIILRDFECFYRHLTNERVTSITETIEEALAVALSHLSGVVKIPPSSKIVIGKGFSNNKYKNISDCLVQYHLLLIYPEYFSVDQFQIVCDTHGYQSLSVKTMYHEFHIEQVIKATIERPSSCLIGESHAYLPSVIAASALFDLVRDAKKRAFWFNSGTIKTSTVHSFKGWEAATVILILEEEWASKVGEQYDELVYTAFTRARKNLIILNVGNAKQHEYFSAMQAKGFIQPCSVSI